ncbi:uncharacterized protein LOC121404607 [Drosophila obscura]|uniref:uncharacterized protein LOC121404607 n=1 Tax=Drosophila obscura TaxID=7282 RepID=UPI001BB15952|nr:uncharacterized protein LOC121404607 [Drosophila obscura]
MNRRYQPAVPKNLLLCLTFFGIGICAITCTSTDRLQARCYFLQQLHMLLKCPGNYQQVFQVYEYMALESLWNYAVHQPTQPLGCVAQAESHQFKLVVASLAPRCPLCGSGLPLYSAIGFRTRVTRRLHGLSLSLITPRRNISSTSANNSSCTAGDTGYKRSFTGTAPSTRRISCLSTSFFAVRACQNTEASLSPGPTESAVPLPDYMRRLSELSPEIDPQIECLLQRETQEQFHCLLLVLICHHCRYMAQNLMRLTDAIVSSVYPRELAGSDIPGRQKGGS